MDTDLLKSFLRQAQRGEHIRRLMVQDEWASLEKLIDELSKQYDTVRGVRTDKEYLIRNSKVDALDELKGTLRSLKEESESAMEELNSRDEEE